MILTVFNWNVLIGISVTLVLYLLALAIFSIVKKVVHKKRFEKEKKEREGVKVDTLSENGNKTEDKVK